MSQLELADLPRHRAGEGAALVAEQLALQDVARDGAAVDGQEPLVAARARTVERVGHQLLAGAAVADDEHAGARGRHQPHLLEEVLHGRRAADDALEAVALVEHLAQVRDLLLELLLLDQVHHPLAQLVEIDGFGEVVVGAHPHGFDGGLDGAVGGHQHDAEIDLPLPHLLQEAEPVHAGHAQVADGEAGVIVLVEELEGLPRVVEGTHGEPRLLEGDGHRFAGAGFIVDYQNQGLLGHARPFWHRRGWGSPPVINYCRSGGYDPPSHSPIRSIRRCLDHPGRGARADRLHQRGERLERGAAQRLGTARAGDRRRQPSGGAAGGAPAADRFLDQRPEVRPAVPRRFLLHHGARDAQGDREISRLRPHPRHRQGDGGAAGEGLRPGDAGRHREPPAPPEGGGGDRSQAQPRHPSRLDGAKGDQGGDDLPAVARRLHPLRDQDLQDLRPSGHEAGAGEPVPPGGRRLRHRLQDGGPDRRGPRRTARRAAAHRGRYALPAGAGRGPRSSLPAAQGAPGGGGEAPRGAGRTDRSGARGACRGRAGRSRSPGRSRRAGGLPQGAPRRRVRGGRAHPRLARPAAPAARDRRRTGPGLVREAGAAGARQGAAAGHPLWAHPQDAGHHRRSGDRQDDAGARHRRDPGEEGPEGVARRPHRPRGQALGRGHRR